MKVRVDFVESDQPLVENCIVSTPIKDLYIKVSNIQDQLIWANRVGGYPIFNHVLFGTSKYCEFKLEECKVVQSKAFIGDNELGDFEIPHWMIWNQLVNVNVMNGRIIPICPCCGK